MEFENQHHHHQPHQLDDVGDGDEEEEEEEDTDLPPTTHPHTDSPAATHHPPRKAKYKECLKNHAIAIGGHAVDGCGEFIPAGNDGTLESLKCAACDCHRNFHRRAGVTSAHPFPFPFHHHHRPQFGYLQTSAPQPRLLALPSSSGGGGYADLEENYYYSKSNPGKKRFRTKFTQEQKMKMGEMAERLGWRMQKQDEEMVEHFCNEIGITRQVLKVWMHNNKNTLGKKPAAAAAAAVDDSINE